MNYGVTVRANWAQVFLGIYAIVCSCPRQWNSVVHVDEAGSD